MPEERRFDPRFNPAFQRGYDASERVRRAHATPALTAEDIAFGRTALPELDYPPAPPADGADEPQAAPPPRPEIARGRNPFIVTLWMMAVVFVAGGIGLPIALSDLSTAPGTLGAPAFLLAQASVILSPLIVTTGLATFCGLLFWHAARWARMRD